MNIGGGGAADIYFKWIRGQAPIKMYKTKFPSLLIRFIKTTDGKYKTSGFFAISILKCF